MQTLEQTAARQTRATPSSKASQGGWRSYLSASFPSYTSAGFAQRHVDFWEHVWSIRSGERARPFIGLWPRGGAKSTSAELAIVAVSERKVRHYALYICETQDQADKHVASVSGAMESVGIERAINKYGNSKGWRRNRLRTADFTVDSLGLDTAARGIKVDAQRPDLIIFDDVDSITDTANAIKKKIETITSTILPTGTADCVMIGMQNIIHRHSIFAQLADKRADFLLDRIVSGPFKAIDNLEYVQNGDQFVITGGTATWEGQSLANCLNYITSWGIRAFLRECQHLIGDREGALWTKDIIDRTRVPECPKLDFVVVAIDPSAGSKDSSDECGIGVGGRDSNRHGYAVADYTMRARPKDWATRAIAAYIIHSANIMVAETNQGGEMVEDVLRGVTRDAVADELYNLGYPRELAISGLDVAYTTVHASDGKRTRAEPVSNLFEQGKGHIIGVMPQLESEMTSWIPGEGKSPNRIDWLVWAFSELGILMQGALFHDDDADYAAFLRGEDEEF